MRSTRWHGIFIAALALCSVFAHAQTTNEEQVLAVEQQMFDAIKNQDENAIKSLLAEDFQLRNGTDEYFSKSGFVKAATSLPGTLKSIGSDDMRVLLYGDIAVVSGSQLSALQIKDGSIEHGITVFTDVLARRDGKWLFVFVHTLEERQE